MQSRILRLLAAHRSPESYVAGSTPLNRDRSRFSEDIDVFHDREERVAQAAAEDTATLQAKGLDVTWLRREPAIYSAEIGSGNERTHLEWVVDSDFRFFPTVQDELFGYVIHPIDLATNKVMAAAGRQKAGDAVDLITIHHLVLPLGAVIWAAVGKAPGYTPEGLIAEIRRHTVRYREEDLRAVASNELLDPKVFHGRLRIALNQAESFVARMPTEKAGLLFLKGGRVVQPDPDRLDEYTTHAGQRRGHWPSNSEIIAAMFEYYGKKPPSP
ncbi:MAG: hypothetical protein AUK55_07050 [Syntrophobacteraceae bacterium CG2_30_61_12]|nr:MAG: hypothetical protein AUK55_07050 [Syntrophobacteraceae bacterium CG2_30_61_12]PIU31062.1 MAG: hypothetical protein COT06_10165 [Syntrophobacteraceae bacterium CG07_land_8_20_14_0_80_61_8]